MRITNSRLLLSFLFLTLAIAGCSDSRQSGPQIKSSNHGQESKPEKKSAAIIGNLSDLVASIHIGKRILPIDLREALIGTLKSDGQDLTDQDRLDALANLAFAASVDAEILDANKFDKAPKYRVSHVVFSFLVPFQKTAEDTPDVLYTRFINHWKDQCLQAGIELEFCPFKLNFEQEEWMTPLPDFYKPVNSAEWAVNDLYEYTRGYAPLAYRTQLLDEQRDAQAQESKTVDTFVAGLSAALIEKINPQTAVESDVRQALVAGVDQVFLDVILQPSVVASHEKVLKDQLSPVIPKIVTLLKGRGTGSELSFQKDLSEALRIPVTNYIRKTDFINLNTAEKLIRITQVSEMKKRYAWIHDETGTDIRTPYGESVATFLAPAWTMHHGDNPFPKGRLFIQQLSGPAYGSPYHSAFVKNVKDWDAMRIKAATPPVDFRAFRDVIQDQLDMDYLGTKRGQVLSSIKYDSEDEAEGLAPPQYRESAIRSAWVYQRSNRFGLIRLPKGSPLNEEVRKLGGLISPADPKAQSVFEEGIQKLGLQSKSSVRDYRAEFSVLYHHPSVGSAQTLDELFEGLSFRRELNGVRNKTWMGKPHYVFPDSQTGGTIYVLMLSEQLIDQKQLDTNDSKLDQKEVWDHASDLYAKDKMMKDLVLRLKEISIEIIDPVLALGPNAVSYAAPNSKVILSAISKQLNDLEADYDEETAWKIYSSSLKALPIRPKDFAVSK